MTGRGRTLLDDPAALLGLLLLSLLLAAALLAPWLTPYASEGAGTPNMANKLLPPSPAHPFGADEMGRDLLARVLFGARTSLALVILVIGSSLLVGASVGLVAGYTGGWIDGTAMRLVDVLLAFPPLLLAILLITVFGGGFGSVVLTLVLVWWPTYALLMRGQVRSLRSRPYIEAARAVGVPPLGILSRHLLPHAVGPLVIQATMDAGAVVLVAASLSFIGLGPKPPAADWGLMINTGRQFVLSGSWWVAGFPGLAIMGMALAFALVGDGLAAHQPGRRRRRS